jgi:hypothetical protein
MDQLGIDIASQPGFPIDGGDGASAEVGMAQLPSRPS